MEMMRRRGWKKKQIVIIQIRCVCVWPDCIEINSDERLFIDKSASIHNIVISMHWFACRRSLFACALTEASWKVKVTHLPCKCLLLEFLKFSQVSTDILISFQLIFQIHEILGIITKSVFGSLSIAKILVFLFKHPNDLRTSIDRRYRHDCAVNATVNTENFITRR